MQKCASERILNATAHTVQEDDVEPHSKNRTKCDIPINKWKEQAQNNKRRHGEEKKMNTNQNTQ